jgi:hypothetical protein
MTNPPHLTEDPSADDELPPSVAAQHQENPMPKPEEPSRTTCGYQKIKEIAHYLEMDAADPDKVIAKAFDTLKKAERELLLQGDEDGEE